MNKERVRFVNCYLCGARLTAQAAVRKVKGDSGEELLWCAPCVKKQFPRKVKLIKRTLEGLWPQG